MNLKYTTNDGSRNACAILLALLLPFAFISCAVRSTPETSEASVAEASDETGLPDAGELLDHLVMALGGLEAASKIHNRRDRGSVVIHPLGLSGTFTAYATEPDRQNGRLC